MRRRILIATVSGVLLVGVLLSCGEKITVVENQFAGTPVRISGNVLAWLCWIGNVPSRRTSEPRFAVATKDTATIIIIDADGRQDSTYTDSLSRFDRIMGAGLHKIIVRTRYTWPADTFQVYADHDTTLNFDLLYFLVEPDTLRFGFSYQKITDTLGVAEEWNALRRLEAATNGAFTLPDLTWPIACRWVSAYDPKIIRWNLPLASRRDHVVEVCNRVLSVIAADSSHAISSVWITVYPKGYYGCLD